MLRKPPKHTLVLPAANRPNSPLSTGPRTMKRSRGQRSPETPPASASPEERQNITNEAVKLLKIKLDDLSESLKAVNSLKIGLLFDESRQRIENYQFRPLPNRATDALLVPRPRYENWAKREVNELTGRAKMSERSRNVIDNRALLLMEFGKSRNVYETE